MVPKLCANKQFEQHRRRAHAGAAVRSCHVAPAGGEARRSMEPGGTLVSFDIFLVCLDHGKVATFPRSMIEEAFAPFIESRQRTSWKLTNSLADVWIGEDEAEPE